ncbi:MAG: 4-hydroxyphenylacetate 3-hydroxylase N-terminal domain-containing protein, partial [Butyricicoccus sp.]|nr:4-hydroxyphenylacetate 3-hydroxylase N-terminal domain-containing protein [Butyricicoccus sp.]
MMTKEQYIESLRKLNLNLWMFGKKIDNPVDDPIIRPSLNSFAATYEAAEDPENEDLMVATSHLTGKKINRFTHMHQSTDDLIKKVKMQRML